MRATFIHGPRDLRVGDKAPPAPAGDDVLVRVAGVGICGSDLHYYTEGGIGQARIAAPFVPGHEFAGWVMDDRPDLDLRAGQLVAVDPAKPCGRCEWCRRDHVNLCPNVEFLGAPPFHGAMTEAVAVAPRQVFAVPARFTVTQAVMLEPLGVAIHALDLAKLQPGETVAVLGCGPIGLCLVQLARLGGAGRVYAVDPVGYRAAAAARLGAHETGATHAAVAAWTDGRGVDLVLEATDSPQAFEHAVEAARIGGRIVLAGIPEGDRYALTASGARRKGLGIKFSRRMGHVYPRAIALVADGRVDLDAIVTHRFPIEEAATAFALQAERRDGALKSIILPNGPEDARATPSTGGDRVQWN
ncbi:MAG: alcohol dehydrogenase catalytic domain-containing protein [Rhodospirillaceae bacterium]|nr:alcohol dehydrogenase catalytic domain-containing protein [Rhodospirillaceae bacterium]